VSPPAILDLAQLTGICLARPPVVRNSLSAAQRTKCPSEGDNYLAECGGRHDQERAYAVTSKLLDGLEGGATGVSVLQDGVMRGGGSVDYHTGTDSCSSGKWKGELTTREHKPELITQLFARKVVTMGFTGTYIDDGTEFEATALVGKRSVRLHVVFRLL
jgi:hypothetical protein